jgi:threonine dehydrogenase-like Zn-dependent dehydrogenase
VVYPRLQGYCNVARVLAVGTGVSGINPGDRVLSFASHRSHFVSAAEDVLFVLGTEDRADDIVCTYLYHLGYNAVLRSGVRAGSRVLVIGLGALGLATAAVANVAGARVLGLSDHVLAQRIAVDSGASAVFARSDTGALRTALSEGLADVVIVTTNSWDDWAIALELSAIRGTIACLGFPGRGQAPGSFNPLDSRFFYAKQLRIEAVGHSPEKRDARGFLRFNERDNLKYLAELIVSGRLNPRLLASDSYPGGDIARAYRDLLDRRNSPVTFLLRWH